MLSLASHGLGGVSHKDGSCRVPMLDRPFGLAFVRQPDVVL